MNKNNRNIEFLPLMKFRAYKNWRSDTLSVCSSRGCRRKKNLYFTTVITKAQGNMEVFIDDILDVG